MIWFFTDRLDKIKQVLWILYRVTSSTWGGPCFSLGNRCKDGNDARQKERERALSTDTIHLKTSLVHSKLHALFSTGLKRFKKQACLTRQKKKISSHEIDARPKHNPITSPYPVEGSKQVGSFHVGPSKPVELSTPSLCPRWKPTKGVLLDPSVTWHHRLERGGRGGELLSSWDGQVGKQVDVLISTCQKRKNGTRCQSLLYHRHFFSTSLLWLKREDKRSQPPERSRSPERSLCHGRLLDGLHRMAKSPPPQTRSVSFLFWCKPDDEMSSTGHCVWICTIKWASKRKGPWWGADGKHDRLSQGISTGQTPCGEEWQSMILAKEGMSSPAVQGGSCFFFIGANCL